MFTLIRWKLSETVLEKHLRENINWWKPENDTLKSFPFINYVYKNIYMLEICMLVCIYEKNYASRQTNSASRQSSGWAA